MTEFPETYVDFLSLYGFDLDKSKARHFIMIHINILILFFLIDLFRGIDKNIVDFIEQSYESVKKDWPSSY